MTEPAAPTANGPGLAPFASAFSGPQHQPFHLQGGDTAVLLIHGFPGSPAEMRPLAGVLHEAGYTVRGPLLPGFGPDLATLPQRTPQDWVNTAVAHATALRAGHGRVVLGGLSMGGAVVLRAAARLDYDGLLLINPFWRLGPDWMSAVWPALRRVVPRIRPFGLISPNFDDPRFRAALEEFAPGVDFDDPAVQTAVRHFSIPAGLVDNIGATGQAAYDAAARLPARPTLVLQGAQDEIVLPQRTAQLRARLPAHTYYELMGDHELPDGKQPSWPDVQRAVLALLAEVAERPPVLHA